MNLNVPHPSSAYSQTPLVAVYPGSFDPLTNGHLDIIRRGASLFPTLVVAVLVNQQKRSLFSLEDRVAMIGEAVSPHQNVQVQSFSGLLVDFCRDTSARVVLRGLRSNADYEFEQPMSIANRGLLPGLEVVFLMASPEYAFISSRLVREIYSLGGDIHSLVPPAVSSRLTLK